MVTPTKASRSSFTFKTPLPTNDDDDERRRSRSVISSAGSDRLNSSQSLIEDNEELKICLQQYMDNKINKENAFQTNLIDTLANLVTGHRKYVKNFQVVGASLEASSKIYGYRVDIVHTEVLRMSGGLTRMNAAQKNAEENGEEPNNDDSIVENANDPENRAEKTKAKAKKRRQQSSTVTKCKASINGKLDTVPFLDPVFADIKSNLTDINSSNRAFLNTLESNNSEILFDYDNPYWDGAPNDFVFCEQDNLSENEKFYFMKYHKLDGPIKMRTMFREYYISDKPCDMTKILESTLGDNTNNDDSAGSDHDFGAADDDHHTNSVLDGGRDSPRMTFAFDANAQVEPVQETIIHLPADLDNNEFSIDEIDALNTVRGVKRAQIIIDNLQPCEASLRKLEYSYRPLTEISKYWAGPSYWKFKPSQPLRTVEAQQKRSLESGKINKNAAAKKKTKRFAVLDLMKFEPDVTLFKPFDPNRKPKNIMKNWDPKKLKLPMNHHINEDYFDKLSYAPGVKLKNKGVPTGDLIELALKQDSVNSNQEIPNGIENNDDDDDDDGVMGGDTDFQNDDHHPADDINANENLNLSNLISQNLMGPQKIEKIVIPYATKAKIINMKQLKLSCSKVINEPTREQGARVLTDYDRKYLKKLSCHLKNSNENYHRGHATFFELYETLPLHLSETLKENLSVPIAFSAILHLANEQNFRFVPTDETLRDFKIIKVQDGRMGEGHNHGSELAEKM